VCARARHKRAGVAPLLRGTAPRSAAHPLTATPRPRHQVIEGNPCYEYVAHIVFPWFGSFEVARSDKNGGSVTYTTLDELAADYSSGALHPGACGIGVMCVMAVMCVCV
jgi:hypothetical protein